MNSLREVGEIDIDLWHVVIKFNFRGFISCKHAFEVCGLIILDKNRWIAQLL